MRQVILDTETTGIEVTAGHRIIEIGAVEVVDRHPTGEHFHEYLQPDRDIDAGAQEVHGISAESLVGKPRFADVAESLFDFVADAELIMHNAPFDVGFLNAEFALLERERFPRLAQALGSRGNHCRGALDRICQITDSLALARAKHPGSRNSLDALCRRYEVDSSSRTFHGALLDAQLLAEVYLRMTGGQAALFGGAEQVQDDAKALGPWQAPETLPVLEADEAELAEHEAFLALLDERSAEGAVWQRRH